MLDFPNTPQIGDILNGPSGQSWVWDGTKWTNSINGGAALVPEPPNDGTAYLRKNGAWVPMTSMSVAMTANIATPVNAWTQVMSLNVGNQGTWLVNGQVSWFSSAGSANVAFGVWDDTTQSPISASQNVMTTTGYYVPCGVSGIVSNPRGPIVFRIGANNAGTASWVTNPAASFFAGTPVSGMTAVRIG